MPKKLKPTKNWSEVPDMMEPQDYADVMGVTVQTAYRVFNSSGFPKKFEGGRANKHEVMRYLKIKDYSENQSTLYNLLIEVRDEIRKFREEENAKKELLKKAM